MGHDQFVLKFFSTDAIADVGKVAKFIAQLKESTGIRNLSGQWIKQGDRKVYEVSDIDTFLEAGLPDWSGMLTIAFSDKHGGVTGSMELLRLPLRNGKSASGDAANYRCHVVTVELPFAIREEMAAEDRLFELIYKLSITLRVNLAIGNENDGFLANLNSPFGLEAGLPDAYRIMVMGPCFTKIISRKRLENLDVYRKRWVEDQWFAIQIDEDICAVAGERIRLRRRKIKEGIGEGYFANFSNPPQLGTGGQMGLLSFVKNVLKVKRDLESERRMAKNRPKINWSGVFERNMGGGK